MGGNKRLERILKLLGRLNSDMFLRAISKVEKVVKVDERVLMSLGFHLFNQPLSSSSANSDWKTYAQALIYSSTEFHNENVNDLGRELRHHVILVMRALEQRVSQTLSLVASEDADDDEEAENAAARVDGGGAGSAVVHQHGDSVEGGAENTVGEGSGSKSKKRDKPDKDSSQESGSKKTKHITIDEDQNEVAYAEDLGSGIRRVGENSAMGKEGKKKKRRKNADSEEEHEAVAEEEREEKEKKKEKKKGSLEEAQEKKEEREVTEKKKKEKKKDLEEEHKMEDGKAKREKGENELKKKEKAEKEKREKEKKTEKKQQDQDRINRLAEKFLKQQQGEEQMSEDMGEKVQVGIREEKHLSENTGGNEKTVVNDLEDGDKSGGKARSGKGTGKDTKRRLDIVEEREDNDDGEGAGRESNGPASASVVEEKSGKSGEKGKKGGGSRTAKEIAGLAFTSPGTAWADSSSESAAKRRRGAEAAGGSTGPKEKTRDKKPTIEVRAGRKENCGEGERERKNEGGTVGGKGGGRGEKGVKDMMDDVNVGGERKARYDGGDEAEREEGMQDLEANDPEADSFRRGVRSRTMKGKGKDKMEEDEGSNEATRAVMELEQEGESSTMTKTAVHVQNTEEEEHHEEEEEEEEEAEEEEEGEEEDDDERMGDLVRYGEAEEERVDVEHVTLRSPFVNMMSREQSDSDDSSSSSSSKRDSGVDEEDENGRARGQAGKGAKSHKAESKRSKKKAADAPPEEHDAVPVEGARLQTRRNSGTSSSREQDSNKTASGDFNFDADKGGGDGDTNHQGTVTLINHRRGDGDTNHVISASPKKKVLASRSAPTKPAPVPKPKADVEKAKQQQQESSQGSNDSQRVFTQESELLVTGASERGIDDTESEVSDSGEEPVGMHVPRADGRVKKNSQKIKVASPVRRRGGEGMSGSSSKQASPAKKIQKR